MATEQDIALLARNGERQVELRGPCPASVVAVLDAVSLSRGGMSRTDLVNEILGKWAREEAHRVNVVARVLRGNPDAAEALGIELG